MQTVTYFGRNNLHKGDVFLLDGITNKVVKIIDDTTFQYRKTYWYEDWWALLKRTTLEKFNEYKNKCYRRKD